jgi:hypothetical protein
MLSLSLELAQPLSNKGPLLCKIKTVKHSSLSTNHHFTLLRSNKKKKKRKKKVAFLSAQPLVHSPLFTFCLSLFFFILFSLLFFFSFFSLSFFLSFYIYIKGSRLKSTHAHTTYIYINNNNGW